MSYRCKYFDIRELVSPKVFADRGELAWQLLDPRLCVMLDKIHDKFGTTYCNTWHWGGRFDQRVLRNPVDIEQLKKEKIWLDYGQHESGRAADMPQLLDTGITALLTKATMVGLALMQIAAIDWAAAVVGCLARGPMAYIRKHRLYLLVEMVGTVLRLRIFGQN